MMPKLNAPQRRHGLAVCNRCVPCAGALNLGRWVSMHILIPLGILLLLGNPRSPAAQVAEGAKPPQATFALKEVLPEGKCDLEVMKVAVSERAAELEARIVQATARKRDWFLEYLKQTKPGEPMAYHKNLGVSSEEYAEYLREAKRRKVTPSGKTLPCRFILEGTTLRLDVGNDASPLSRIRIDLSTNRLTASAGDIGLPVWKSSDREDTAIGPWEGYAWKFEDADLEQFNVRIVELWIYRLKGSGQILWRLQDSQMVQKEMKKSFDILLQHAPKGAQPGSPTRGGQPIRSETNRTSSAAGFRR